MAEKNTVPKNQKPRTPTAKKNFSLDNYKKKKGSEDVPQKPLLAITKINISYF